MDWFQVDSMVCRFSLVWLNLKKHRLKESDSIDRARDVFEQAYKTLRTATDKEERLMLVEHIGLNLKYEKDLSLDYYYSSFSRKNEEIKIRLLVFSNIFQNVLNNVERFLQKMEYMKFGIVFLRNYRLFLFSSDSGQWEEFMQLVFPDDEAVQLHLKLLAMAKRWKKRSRRHSSSSTATIEYDYREHNDLYYANQKMMSLYQHTYWWWRNERWIIILCISIFSCLSLFNHNTSVCYFDFSSYWIK